MSAITIKKYLLCLVPVVGLAVGYGLMSLSHRSTAQRHVASLPMPGLGKHLAPVRVQILAPDVLPDYDEQEVEITGYVTVNQVTPGELEYEWILPEGVELVAGIPSDVWASVRPGQTAVTKISVRGFSKEKRRTLTLESFARIGNVRVGNTAVISSRPEDSMEFIAPEKMKSREDFEAEKALESKSEARQER